MFGHGRVVLKIEVVNVYVDIIHDGYVVLTPCGGLERIKNKNNNIYLADMLN